MDGYWNSKFVLGEIGGPGLSRAGSPGTNIMDVNMFTVGHNWALSPTMVLDSTLAITKMDQSRVAPDFGKNIGTEVWGIPNTNYPVVTGYAGGPDQVKKACPEMAGGACYSGTPAPSIMVSPPGATLSATYRFSDGSVRILTPPTPPRSRAPTSCAGASTWSATTWTTGSRKWDPGRVAA